MDSAPTSSQSFSRAARSSRASENSPSSIPSPTYQWTKALFEYIRSNLWSIRENTSAMAVVLEIMQHALMTLARSPPGTTVGGWELIPHLNPVGLELGNIDVKGTIESEGGSERGDNLSNES